MKASGKVIGERLVCFLFGMAIALQIFIWTQPDEMHIAESKEAFESLKRLNAELAKCLPVDLGEKSILTLVDEDGVLKLHCEKHEVVGFAEQPKALLTSINVPVSVN